MCLHGEFKVPEIFHIALCSTIIKLKAELAPRVQNTQLVAHHELGCGLPHHLVLRVHMKTVYCNQDGLTHPVGHYLCAGLGPVKLCREALPRCGAVAASVGVCHATMSDVCLSTAWRHRSVATRLSNELLRGHIASSQRFLRARLLWLQLLLLLLLLLLLPSCKRWRSQPGPSIMTAITTSAANAMLS